MVVWVLVVVVAAVVMVRCFSYVGVFDGARLLPHVIGAGGSLAPLGVRSGKRPVLRSARPLGILQTTKYKYKYKQKCKYKYKYYKFEYKYE